MAGKFEIYQSEKNEQYYFRLKAGNGEVVLSSQGYKDITGAKKGVESVKNHASDSSNYESLEASDGKAYFNLKAKNGQVIGSSQMYKTVSGRDNGIQAVGNAADGAAVEEV
jgi:uncharacterized protein YegP (UPF0339 family)